MVKLFVSYCLEDVLDDFVVFFCKFIILFNFFFFEEEFVIVFGGDMKVWMVIVVVFNIVNKYGDFIRIGW